eukprot:SAG11_NODE_4058_length_2084_cov_1.175819_2_plen_100_part_00
MQMLVEGHLAQQATKVPILMGSNADEGTTFLNDNVRSRGPGPGSLHDWSIFTFGETIGKEVAAYYGDTDNWDWPKPTPESPCVDSGSDALVSLQHETAA